MRFLIIALCDALVLGAVGYAGWTVYQRWQARRAAAMCTSCQDLAALKANDNVCPGCGNLHLKP